MVIYYNITPTTIAGACFYIVANTFFILAGLSQQRQKMKYVGLLIVAGPINIVLLIIPFFNPQGIDPLTTFLFFILPVVILIFTYGLVFILISTNDFLESQIWPLLFGCVSATSYAFSLIWLLGGPSFPIISIILNVNAPIFLILFGYYHKEKFFIIAGSVMQSWQIYTIVSIFILH